MNFEHALIAMVMVQAALCLIHSFKTRSAAASWFLLVTGVGFGYLFPASEINLMTLYTFHGKLNFLHMPIHLGFAWYGLYYLSLCLAERLLPGRERKHHQIKLAITCGVLLGIMESQFDPTLIALGIIEFNVPSFATYSMHFNHGFPIFHAYLGFAYAFIFLVFGDHRRQRAAVYALSLLSLVLFPVAIMGCVPLMTPFYQLVGARLDNWLLVIIDTAHFLSSFIGLGVVFAMWIRFAARRVFQHPKEIS